MRYILSDQPEAPKYFAVMKRVNKEGPAVLGDAGLPESLPVEGLRAVIDSATVIDLTLSGEFAKQHVPRTINIPTSMLAGWAGWVVDYSKPVYLIAEPGQLPEAIRVLRKIGLDDVRGYFDVAEVVNSGLATQSSRIVSPEEVAGRVKSSDVRLIDVRSDSEWNAARIAAAEHQFLGRLPDRIDAIDHDKPVIVHCETGARSAIAASILQAEGFDVVDMAGGFGAWQEAGLPVDSSDATTCAADPKLCGLS